MLFVVSDCIFQAGLCPANRCAKLSDSVSRKAGEHIWLTVKSAPRLYTVFAACSFALCGILLRNAPQIRVHSVSINKCKKRVLFRPNNRDI